MSHGKKDRKHKEKLSEKLDWWVGQGFEAISSQTTCNIRSNLPLNRLHSQLRRYVR